jgi:high-affinity nickel-transport protein
MESLPNDWVALAAVVFLLGLKHGFDADHLATIDGLTRFNLRQGSPLARACGMLFSLGHGVVVIAIALAVGTLARRWQVPGWLEASGAWISIGFLFALGVINLRAVLTTRHDELVQPVGLKGRWLGRLRHASHPLAVAAVGALFALSFDTVSQAALFAAAGVQYGGWGHALALGLLFTLGMLVTDGVNGLWISRLIRRADQMALVASRVMSLAVSGTSLLVAAFGVMKQLMPAVDGWSEGKELAFGLSVVCVIAGSFLLALRLTRAPAVAAARSVRFVD